MKTDNAVISENTCIAADVFRMKLKTSIADEIKCGQFVNVSVPGYFLRRPISCAEASDGEMTLIYKIVGAGTKQMSLMKEDETVSLFGPLGNGFPMLDEDILLAGGGIGVPPLLYTARLYREKGREVTVVLGFNRKEDVILEYEFEALGCQVYTAVMDGTYGISGTVSDGLDACGCSDRTILACGPLPMLKAVSERFDKGYVSLEARMACGMGACMGCVVKDHDGSSYRVCSDGPVFEIGKVVL